MIVVIGVISPAAVWVMPRQFVEQLRRDFPQHAFREAWDRDTLRRLLPRFQEIIEAHRRGTRFGIGVDSADGLVA